MHRLTQLGWSQFFEEQLDRGALAGRIPARIAEEGPGLYRVLAEPGEMWGELAGRLRQEGVSGARRPAVGDWVLVSSWDSDRARIEILLKARTQISRKAAGKRGDEQVLAANVDTVFVVTSPSREFNLRRLERYLALAWESGGRPVVVLNKSDLVEEPVSWRASIESVALGVPVLITSGVRGDGISILEVHLRPGETAAFVGSSGVGKSTLINALAGEERQRVAPVRTSDGRGRHSTTSRRLIALSGGAILIDTPGLREVQLGEGTTGLERAFADVSALAAQCRFRDCRHEAEPGCAVLEAEAAGRIESERLESYRKLERERGYLESRQNPAARAARLQKTKKLHKEQRRFYREGARDE